MRETRKIGLRLLNIQISTNSRLRDAAILRTSLFPLKSFTFLLVYFLINFLKITRILMLLKYYLTE